MRVHVYRVWIIWLASMITICSLVSISVDGLDHEMRVFAAESTWQLMGLNGQSVFSLGVSPNYINDHTLFAGADGGVYRSNDGGATWAAAKGGVGRVYALSLSPDYAHDNVIYAGTTSEVYRSLDGGDTWTTVNYDNFSSVKAIALSPNYAEDHTLFVGAYDGIHRSFDGGNSWLTVSNLFYSGDPEITALAVSPVLDGLLFAGNAIPYMPHFCTPGGEFEGIWRSYNEGGSWQYVSNNVDCPLVYSLAVSPEGSTIFAGTAGKVLRSDTWYGSGWASVLDVSQNVYSLAISPAYTTDHTIFAGSGYFGVFRSIDGGNNWVNFGLTENSVPGSNHVLSLSLSPSYASDGIVFAGTGGGIWAYGLPVSTPTPTNSPTPTPTNTATLSPTPTSTATATSTSSPTSTSTATAPSTSSPTPTPTATATGTSSPTPTSTATATGTWSPTPTSTATATGTWSPTPTSTATGTSTSSPTPTSQPQAITTVGPVAGSNITLPNDRGLIDFPPGLVSSVTTFTYTQQTAPGPTRGSFGFAGRSFQLVATNAFGNPVTNFSKSFTIALQYEDADWQAAGILENSLNLFYWNGTAWTAVLPCEGCSLDPERNRLVAVLDHLTEFALFGKTSRYVHLPILMRGYAGGW